MVKLRCRTAGVLATLGAVVGIAAPAAIAGSNGQQVELLTWSPLLSSGNHMGKVQICGDNQHNTPVCSPITALPPTQPYELHNWWFKGPLTIHEWTYNGQEVSGPCINPQDGQTPAAVPTSQASSTFVCDADFGPSAPFQPPPAASGSGPAPSTSGGSGPVPATGGTGVEHAPRGQIDRAAAAAWALANVNTAPYVFRDDCTDFVSEALKSGGVTRRRWASQATKIGSSSCSGLGSGTVSRGASRKIWRFTSTASIVTGSGIGETRCPAMSSSLTGRDRPLRRSRTSGSSPGCVRVSR